MTRKTALDELLNTTPRLWTGRQFSRVQSAVPTGHARLDARLPGKGWPLGAVTELLCAKPGLGEFSLLFPALAGLGRRGQWVVLVDPPWIPYPPALQAHGLWLERLLLVRTQDERHSLWACEQALCSGHGGALLAWPGRIAFTRLRRLQLAAEANAKLVFLFRPATALRDPSPAALRLQLEPDGQRGARINVIKCRGNHPPEPAWIPRPFSAYANPSQQTAAHALACHSTSSPGARSVHPGPGLQQGADSGQRYH